MISKSDCKKIVDLAVEHGKGKVDGVEVIVTGSEVATSRFANNGMTQNQAPSNVNFSVRVVSDGRQARLCGDDFSPEGVKQVVDNAITAVKFVAKDDGLLPIPDLAATKPPAESYVSRFDDATARL
ncbi:MAG TPA: DNA gyrase modulator, partial [Chroococcales cyanobacterium]